MLSIAEVLERLAGSRSPDEVAETIRRLLPLPTLWTALREPGVAERCLAADGGVLSPGVVLLAACGYSRFADIPGSPVDEGQPPTSETLAADIQGEPSTRQILLRCARLVADASTPEEIAPLLLDHPEAWREALACAWPHLGQAQVWIRALESGGDVGLQLAGLALTSARRIGFRPLGLPVSTKRRKPRWRWRRRRGTLLSRTRPRRPMHWPKQPSPMATE
jgi:hypothetical protein